MPYRLEDRESMPAALSRSAREQLDSAIAELTDGIKVDPVRAVHKARKSLKKARSLLRLGRAALDTDQRRRENAVFRATARRLSANRDADAAIQKLDDLADRYAGQVPKATFDAIRKRLESRADVERVRTVEAEAVNDLKAARLRIDDWQLHRDGWTAVTGGLDRGYRRGRRAFKRARAQPTVENLHEWRKRVKDLWYHLRWLAPLSPHVLGGHAKDAHRLSDVLGDDHDLAVLQETLSGMAGDVPHDLDPVSGLIEHRRHELQAEANFLGARIYAERPRLFLRRLHRYWKSWRNEARAKGSRQPAALAEATSRASAV